MAALGRLWSILDRAEIGTRWVDVDPSFYRVEIGSSGWIADIRIRFRRRQYRGA